MFFKRKKKNDIGNLIFTFPDGKKLYQVKDEYLEKLPAEKLRTIQENANYIAYLGVSKHTLIEGQKMVKLPVGWLSLDNIPPDEFVQVIDAQGNTAHAYPTWYPFNVVPNHNKVGKWTSDVVPCEPYWDGGWMVVCEGLTSNIGTVIGWRPVNPTCSYGN